MIENIKVEITLRDNKTGSYLRIPVTPEVIEYQGGEAKAETVSIVNLGDVDFPTGVALDSVAFESFFPARYDSGYCNTSQLLTPLEYVANLTAWKNGRTPLQLICPAAGLNTPVYLKNLTHKYEGFEGDITYQVEFRELKTIVPKQLSANGTPPSNKPTLEERPAATASPAPANQVYVVVAGDGLIRVAKKLGISDWYNDLYVPNKALIGPNPDAISPGQRLEY